MDNNVKKEDIVLRARHRGSTPAVVYPCPERVNVIERFELWLRHFVVTVMTVIELGASGLLLKPPTALVICKLYAPAEQSPTDLHAFT